MELEPRSNEQIRKVLGARIRTQRKSRGWTQQELANRAGLSRPTLSALERGHDVNLDSFVSALRPLDLLEALATSVPEPAVSPIDELDRRPRRRRSTVAPRDSTDWVWGDEQ